MSNFYYVFRIYSYILYIDTENIVLLVIEIIEKLFCLTKILINFTKIIFCNTHRINNTCMYKYIFCSENLVGYFL